MHLKTIKYIGLALVCSGLSSIPAKADFKDAFKSMGCYAKFNRLTKINEDTYNDSVTGKCGKLQETTPNFRKRACKTNIDNARKKGRSLFPLSPKDENIDDCKEQAEEAGLKVIIDKKKKGVLFEYEKPKQKKSSKKGENEKDKSETCDITDPSKIEVQAKDCIEKAEKKGNILDKIKVFFKGGADEDIEDDEDNTSKKAKKKKVKEEVNDEEEDEKPAKKVKKKKDKEEVEDEDEEAAKKLKKKKEEEAAKKKKEEEEKKKAEEAAKKAAAEEAAKQTKKGFGFGKKR